MSHTYLSLSTPVAIVTGANQGIGAAIARRLAASGVAVFITYFRMPPLNDPANPAAYDEVRAGDAEEVLAAIRAGGGHAAALETDLADADSIPGIFDAAEAAFGPANILVNNASSWIADSFLANDTDHLGRTLAAVSAATFDHQFAVDARATALMIAEFARRCSGPGRIVTMTSDGEKGWPGEVSYSAAKRAGENYTLSAAKELFARGITSNAVHPPATDTGWVSADVRAAIENAGDRIAQPEDVAEFIASLMSDAGRHVTGNVIQMK